MACKPGSVPGRNQGIAIHLGCPLPDTSRDRPGRRCGNASISAGIACPIGRPYLVLLQVGFTVPRLLPARAVRSYRPVSPLPPTTFAMGGGLFSVALSLGSPPAAVSRHLRFHGARTFLHLSELLSHNAPSLWQRPPGQLTRVTWEQTERCVKYGVKKVDRAGVGVTPAKVGGSPTPAHTSF